MAIETEVLERMQVWVALGKPKSKFGKMSKAESEMYDRILNETAAAKSKGWVVEIVSEIPRGK